MWAFLSPARRHGPGLTRQTWWSGRRMARALAPITLAAAAGIAFLLAPVAPASAAPFGPLVALAGATPPSPTSYGAKEQGPAAASAATSVQVYFQPANAGQLAAFATAVSTPGTASYHHFLTVPQFAARFGTSDVVVTALDQYLRSKGLSVGQISANRLSQNVTGTSGDVERAFATPLLKFRTAAGAEVIGSTAGPKLPADLAGSVSYVDGLEPWVVPSSNLVRWPRRTVKAGAVEETPRSPEAQAHAQAQGPAAANCGGMASTGLTPAQLDDAYGLSGFDARGDQGQGETIGFIEYGLPDTSAIAGYEACTGATLSIDYVRASSAPTQVDTEVAADVEVIAALAPKASVVIYEASQQGTDLAPWDLAIAGSSAGGLPQVISDSWGSCEQDTGLTNAYYQTEEGLFEEAAAQGQTVLVASGDDGSEGCLDQTQSKELAIYDPASAPFVTSVGGTASDTATSSQYIWNSRNAAGHQCLNTGCSLYGASGGGVSTVWPRPSYQPDSLPQTPACTLGPEGCREIPDVSAIAGDPYGQFCTPRLCGGGGNWVGFGGTSLSAPSWGAAVLLSDEACSTNIGFLNPLLYSEPSSLVGPITSGNNDLSGSHDGMYGASASGGYSMAGGLGYLGGADLSSGALCGPSGGVGSSGSGPGSPGAPGSAGPTTTTTIPPLTGPGSTSAGATPALECVVPVNQPVQGKPDALVATLDANNCAGYLVVTQSGAVSGFGAAITYGSLQSRHLPVPVVAIAATPGYEGYWLMASDGEVFAFGDAKFYGSPGKLPPGAPAVGIAATADGKGYWVVNRDGVIYSFGDAKSYGSLAGTHLNGPVVGMAATPNGQGYWLAASDGGVFGFGDADYHGSLGANHSKTRVIGISADPAGNGYSLATANGSIFSFGAAFYGSRGAKPPPDPVVAIAPSLDRKGYYLIDSGGHVYAYGDAIYGGNATSPPVHRPR
jgi:hypothetical protein